MGAGAGKPSSSGSGNRITVREAQDSNAQVNYTFTGYSSQHQNGYWNHDGNTNFHTRQPNAVNTVYDSTFQSGGRYARNTNLYREEEDEIKFGTLYCNDGRQFVVLKQGRNFFHLDSFENGEWQPLQESMMATGYIQYNDASANEPTVNRSESLYNEYAQPVTSMSLAADSRPVELSGKYGYVVHPEKGKLTTCHVEERLNVHYYYNEDQGIWVRMPLDLEVRCSDVSRMTEQIQEMLPHIRDKHNILSVLRYCNYNTDETISTMLTNEEYFGQNLSEGQDIDESAISEQVYEIQVLKESIKNHEQIIKELKENITNAVKERDELLGKCNRQNEQLDKMREKLALARTQSRDMVVMETKVKEAVGSNERQNMDNAYQKISISTKGIKDELSTFKCTVASDIQSLQALFLQTVTSFVKLKNGFSAYVSEANDIKNLYQRESNERRLLYNQLQEIRGNIKVYCRCRKDDRGDSVFMYSGEQDLSCPAVSGGRSKTFRFDKVFPPSTTQEEIFAEVKSLVTSTIDGYNVCIMAYGQTGSGKTYTMMGPEHNPGVNLRTIKELLELTRLKDTMQFVIQVSLLEVYNEMIRDLLNSNTQQSNLDIHFKGRNLTVKGLTEETVKTYQDVEEIIKKGDKNRSVAETKMNSSSSRSHLVLIIRTQGTDVITHEAIHGTLTLVDLAGSERLSRTEATGQRLVEAAAINKSLTSLGQVFTALRTNSLHVPYRNSKLTHLLQSALGGDGKACLFVNVSPLEENLTESMNTLQFGSAARQIQLGKPFKSAPVVH